MIPNNLNPLGVSRMSNDLFVGAICAGAVTSVTGWLLCDGSAVSRTKYSKLFAAIGTKFGSGDGSTTFNLPNLNKVFPEMDISKNIGNTIEAGLPNITGTQEYVFTGVDSAHTGCLSISTKLSNRLANTGSGSQWSILKFNASKSNTIYGKSNTVQPKALCINYFIKY